MKRKRYNNKYSVNLEFFDMIDTEEKAYLLGYIIADGNIDKNGISLRFHVQRQDYNLLVKINEAMGSDYPIKNHIYKNRMYYRLQIHSTALVERLEKLGIGACKTATVKPPLDQIPQHLHRHFWRGCIDGDGSVYYYNQEKYKTWGIDLTGNIFVITAFETFIRNHVETKRKIRKIKNSYRFGVGGTYIPMQLAKLLYNDASIYLDRKYDKAVDLINSNYKQKNYTISVSKNKLSNLYNNLGEWNKVAQHLNVSRGVLFNYRKKMEVNRP